MTAPTYFWHDYETFGRLPRRDRPAQFAGIRTDAELNEIGTALMVHCQPPTDTLPDPEACLLTGITPQHCQQHGLPEHAFAAAILQALAEPGTVGVGYNTIRFDDEVTRHLFWRNLIDPYAREWQNSCGRWDLLDAVRCAHALRPEGIEWPQHDDGRVSFKLEQLTQANGLVHANAHDALSDVRATVALARLIRERNPRLYEFCYSLRKKDAVSQQIGAVGEAGRPFLHVSGMYPVERGCLGLVWPLAAHPTNKNEVIVWDLAHDPRELLALDAEAIRIRMFTRTEDLPEGTARLPIKSIHLNKSPVVIGKVKTLSPAMAERWRLDLAQGVAHAEAAPQVSVALKGRWAAVFQRPLATQSCDVDEDLYGGFLGTNDRRSLERLRALTPDQLAAKRVAFDDPRLDELLFRYRARNFPATLRDDERERWLQHCSARLHGGVGGGQSLAQFFDQIDTLSEGADERGQHLLGELYEWAEQIAPASA